jgi:hypothetical protein
MYVTLKSQIGWNSFIYFCFFETGSCIATQSGLELIKKKKKKERNKSDKQIHFLIHRKSHIKFNFVQLKKFQVKLSRPYVKIIPIVLKNINLY